MGKTVFASPAYLKAVSKHLGHSCHVFTAKGLADAGLAVLARKKGPFTQAILPPFTPFSALLLTKLPDQGAIHAQSSLLEPFLSALEQRFDAARLHFAPSLTDARPLQWRGWQVSPLYTYQILLADRDPLARWSSNPLRILKTHRPAFSFEEAAAEGARHVAELCVQSYRRHGRPGPTSAAALENLIAELTTSGNVRVFLARHQNSGNVEAALAVLMHEQTAYYWVAGSSPGPAMTVLLGHVLPKLAEDGFALFDFVGANTPSIAEFKRRFGPVLTPYIGASFTRSRLLGALKRWRGR